MIQLAVRMRELVSSNVDALIGKAENPAKMLGLLRTEIEESLIGLHGELARKERAAHALASDAEKVSAHADEWTGKAKIAMSPAGPSWNFGYSFRAN